MIKTISKNYSQNKVGLIRFGLILEAARMLIDHIGHFKLALLEVFIRSVRLNF